MTTSANTQVVIVHAHLMTKPEGSQGQKSNMVMFFSHAQAATEREGEAPWW